MVLEHKDELANKPRESETVPALKEMAHKPRIYSGGGISSVLTSENSPAANPHTFWFWCVSLISPVTYNGTYSDSGLSL